MHMSGLWRIYAHLVCYPHGAVKLYMCCRRNIVMLTCLVAPIFVWWENKHFSLLSPPSNMYAVICKIHHTRTVYQMFLNSLRDHVKHIWLLELRLHHQTKGNLHWYFNRNRTNYFKIMHLKIPYVKKWIILFMPNRVTFVTPPSWHLQHIRIPLCGPTHNTGLFFILLSVSLVSS